MSQLSAAAMILSGEGDHEEAGNKHQLYMEAAVDELLASDSNKGEVVRGCLAVGTVNAMMATGLTRPSPSRRASWVWLSIGWQQRLRQLRERPWEWGRPWRMMGPPVKLLEAAAFLLLLLVSQMLAPSCSRRRRRQRLGGGSCRLTLTTRSTRVVRRGQRRWRQQWRL